MAKLSLQEQMLKAGLVDKKAAKKAAKQAKKSRTLKREVKAAAETQRNEQQLRDQQLNQERDAVAQKRAQKAQIIQLIDMNQLDLGRPDSFYNFTHQGLIKKLELSEALRQDLIKGRVAIVEGDKGYKLVAKIVADKIAQRDDSFIILLNDVEQEALDEDDPYADYQIPDDLMW